MLTSTGMTQPVDPFGQPVGEVVAHWSPRSWPPATPMAGRHCRVVPLDPALHADSLHAAYAEAADGRDWTYLFSEPFLSLEEYRAALAAQAGGPDPLPHAIVEAGAAHPTGVASFMRIDRDNGVIEIGAIHHAPRLRRRPAATEALFLMMRRAFDELG